MNLKDTIKNIRKDCNNYIDPDLVAFIINDDNLMGTNNILEITDYGIKSDDTFEDRILKIHEFENIYIACGMMTFMPFVRECDIFSTSDYNLKLSPEEFEKYSDEEEKLFGILIKKSSNEYIIGKSDVCSCSIDSSFEKLDESDCEFYTTIKKIIEEKIS